MKILCFDIKMPTFGEISGMNALDASIGKFRELRDAYRDANREYYGEYFFSILDEK
jgi:hypothetical protein